MSLEIYTTVKSIKDSENKKIYLVKSEVDQLFYIHRILKDYNLIIYKILQNIHSIYIPTIYEIVEIDGELHIIEEYINAPTLEQCLLNREINYIEKEKIINQICDAVILLHERHIIHRDIKPENIFYNNDHIILFDFDISRIFQPTQDKDTVILGSVGYAAPEQFGFKQTDERTDIYALGVLINVIYTSKLPNEFLYQGDIKKIIEKSTHIDPNQRYLSVNELKKALEKKEKESWIIPGFRQGKLLNKIIACIGYIMLLLFIASLKVEGVKSWSIEDLGYKLLYIIMFGTIVIFLTNYRNINRYSIFHNSQYKVIRYLGILISMIIAVFVCLLVGSFIMASIETVCS